MRWLWQWRRRERELAEELEFHREMKERKYRELHGMSEQQASERAKRDFGGFEKWKEVCRDVGRWRFLDELWRDLVVAVRMLRKSPVFTLVALVTLTLAIGANTAIFSLMNELMLKALPVPNAQRLAVLRIQPDDYGYTFSYPMYQELEKRTAKQMRVFAFTGRTFQLQEPDGIEQVYGQLVSGEYFAALGTRPQMGRWITAQDDKPGAPNGMVAVVSDGFWRSRMGSDPHAMGKRITINKGVFTVVGVMPKEFREMNRDSISEVFVPFQLEPFIDAPFNSIASGNHFWWFQVGGYLKDGISLESTNAFLRSASRAIIPSDPNDNIQLNGHKLKELYLVAEPGANGLSFLRVQFRKPLTVLMALVAMVLLIACLNLATLMMARSASRGREISTRFALGASRLRLLRQLLTECLFLAVLGTILGLAVSPFLARSLAAILAPQHGPSSSTLDVTPDLAVFGFTALVAILATVLTGTLPAVRSTSNELQGSLRESSASIRGADRRNLWPRLLLAVEVGLSLMLVTGASLLGFSMVKLHQLPIGFEPRGLVYLPIDTNKQGRKGQELVSSYRAVMDEIAGIPGVKAVSAAATIPLSNNWSSSSMKVHGGNEIDVFQNTVGPEYFRAMHSPILQGREFTWADGAAGGKKVILNQAAAKLLFPKGGALGKGVSYDGKEFLEVIGIVSDAKYTTVRDAAPPTAYKPMAQNVQDASSWTLLIRSDGSPRPLIRAAQKVIRRAMPDIPLPEALSMEDTVAESLATERIMAMLALFFGALALLMTGIGLYGTLAYSTERRTGEIGIRLALGAMPSNVISMVCAENGAIAVIGCLLGIGGSVMASKTIASFLFGVSPRDPVMFGVAAVALLLVAAVASLVPALKASKIDPISAIRYE